MTEVIDSVEGKLPKESDGWLLDLFNSMKEEGTITLSTEYIAYTDQFETLFAEVQERYPEAHRKWVYRRLCALRKQGKGKTRINKKVDDEFKISSAQIRVLKALDANPAGLTKREIAALADVPLNMDGIIGSKFMEDSERVEKDLGKRTLRGRGYIKAEYDFDINDKRILKFSITDEGITALREYTTNILASK